MKNKVKFVSILGDSISTYSGYNPIGYKVFYDEYNSLRNDMTSVYDTWWAKVNQFINAYICVNNSYSGSKVAGEKSLVEIVISVHQICIQSSTHLI